MPKKKPLKSSWPKSKRGWNPTPPKTKTSSTTKLAWIVLSIVVIIILCGKMVQFISSLYQPLDSNSVTRSVNWDGSSNINILINSNGYGVVSYDPASKTINVLNIPDDIYMTIPGGFGSWKLQSVYGLGESERPAQGNMLLLKSVSELIGIPLDGYIQTTGEDQKMSPMQLVDEIRKSPLGFTSRNMISNLTTLDMVKYSWNLAQVRFDKVQELDLGKLGVLEPQQLPDQTRIQAVDYNQLDDVLQNLADSRIVNERYSIAIFNATDTPGLAQKFARFITNLGGNVINVTNADTSQQTTTINPGPTGDANVVKSYTYSRIKKNLASDCSRGLKCDIMYCSSQSQSIECQSRAQINIIVGEDFAQNY